MQEKLKKNDIILQHCTTDVASYAEKKNHDNRLLTR